jgi:hypothetical protein
MIEGLMSNWRRWSDLAKLSAGLISGAVAITMVYTLLSGTPKAVLPSKSLFEPVSVEQSLTLSRPELSSTDFVSRPVFALNRKPPIEPAAEPVQTSELPESEVGSEVVGTIDGVKLLGIFGSGEVAGIIIRLDTGKRERLVVGEAVNGWTLQSVTSRGANFRSGAGARANLGMVFAAREAISISEERSVLDEPSRSGPGDSSVDSVSGSGAEGASDAQNVVPQRVSFGSFYGGGTPSGDAESSRGQQ